MPKSTLDQLLDRVLRGVAQGGALLAAACAADPDPSVDAASVSDAATLTDAAPTDASAADGSPPDAATLPFPDPDEIGCRGEGDEFTGPCCDHVACYDPPADDPCPDLAEANQWEVADAAGFHGLGSGTCLCGVTGPYDPADVPGADGRCCFIVTTQACEGRPLVIAAELRIAPTTRRADWS